MQFFREGDHWQLLAGLPFDVVSGFLGLYFFTPLSTWHWSLQLLCRAALLLVAAVLIGGGVRQWLGQKEVRIHRLGWFLVGIGLRQG
jgi:hypothetical protein